MTATDSKEYRVVDESVLGHCCIEASIVDSFGQLVCEFTEKAAAENVAAIINAHAAAASAEPTAPQWQPIETAPKGGGADRVDDPAYVTPPRLLLFSEGCMVVGFWEAYHDIGGSGYIGGSAWTEDSSGELMQLTIGEPTHWMHLPAAPGSEG